MSRKAARDSAFKIIYQTPFHSEVTDSENVMELFLSDESQEKLTQQDLDYVRQTVNNCFENIESIDECLSGSLKNWTLSRISKVNLAIMRLSLSEIKYGEIPYQVSINEAVELAKKYSDDDAPAFVNGVLADVIKE